MTIEEKKKKFNRILFKWHKDNYRSMPWRDTHDPYRILISEIMLQQTQVERVRIKYAEFLKAFPTVHALATASLGDVLRVWSGLGYNRRAKYLHECAREVVRMYGGKFPNAEVELKKLSGIGPSTAAALISFAFDGESPMIDTNIRRILIRTFFPPPKLSKLNFDKKVLNDKALYVFAKTLIPKGRGRMWNYAMLDVGATVCTARNHSNDCPLNALHGSVGDFVYKKPQSKFTDSRRYYRGRILKELAVKKHITRSGLLKIIDVDTPTMNIDDILDDLKKEGLITFIHGKIALPS